MHRREIDSLDARRAWWVPATVSPRRDWPGAPGCRRGARFMIDCATMRASRESFAPFDSQSRCLEWVMRHRQELERALPGARIRAVRLDRWLLGLE